jgi:hypothetical protein
MNTDLKRFNYTSLCSDLYLHIQFYVDLGSVLSNPQNAILTIA